MGETLGGPKGVHFCTSGHSPQAAELPPRGVPHRRAARCGARGWCFTRGLAAVWGRFTANIAAFHAVPCVGLRCSALLRTGPALWRRPARNRGETARSRRVDARPLLPADGPTEVRADAAAGARAARPTCVCNESHCESAFWDWRGYGWSAMAGAARRRGTPGRPTTWHGRCAFRRE